MVYDWLEYFIIQKGQTTSQEYVLREGCKKNSEM